MDVLLVGFSDFLLLFTRDIILYTRYPIVARALGLAAECVARAKVSCIQGLVLAREQKYLAYKSTASINNLVICISTFNVQIINQTYI